MSVSDVHLHSAGGLNGTEVDVLGAAGLTPVQRSSSSGQHLSSVFIQVFSSYILD